MAVIAYKCKHIKVIVVDLNKEKIDAWNNKDLTKLPVYEPGLEDLIKRCRGKNLFFKTGKFTFSIIFIDPNIKKKGRLTNILKKAVIIGSTSDSRTNIGEKAILTAPIIRIRKGLIFKLGKNFFRFFFFYNWKMDDCRKQRNYYRHYPGYIEWTINIYN